jgi:hypothetical protein
MRLLRDRIASFDLELAVLGAAQMDRATAFHPLGRNEPLAAVGHEDEEEVESIQGERLDQAAPASVTSASAHRHSPALFVTTRRGLHLYARKSAIEVSNQVVMRAVAERDRDMRALSHEPVESCAFTDITLFARRKHPVGEDPARGNSPP